MPRRTAREELQHPSDNRDDSKVTWEDLEDAKEEARHNDGSQYERLTDAAHERV